MRKRIFPSLVNLVATPKLAKEAVSKPMSRGDFLGEALSIAIAGTAGALLVNSNGSNTPIKQTPSGTIFRYDPETGEFEQEKSAIEKEIEKEVEVYPEEVERFYLKNYTGEDKLKAIEAVFAEARGVDDKIYLGHVVSSYVTRALESGKTVSDEIYRKAQYSYLNKEDINQVKSGNAPEIASKDKVDEEAYGRCVEVVEGIFKNGLTRDELITHYFTRKIDVPLEPGSVPDWAFIDFKGKKIPKTPKYIIEHEDPKKGTMITRFYYTPDTGDAVLAAV